MKREYVHAPLHSVCGMAVPQLVWVNVEPCGSSPLAADLPDGLPGEVPLSAGAMEYVRLSFAAAKRLKKLERVTGHSNSPCFGSFSKEVDLTAIGENFDVLPPDSGDLRNPATQQVGAPDKGVITRSVPVVVNGSGNGCHQQPELLFAQRLGALVSVEKCTWWHWIARHPCDR